MLRARSLLALPLAALVLAAPGGERDRADAAQSGPTRQLSIGATSASSGTYAYFVAVAEIVNQNVPNVNLTVVETGAAAENTRRVVSGAIDMGLSGTPEDYNAYNGQGEFRGRAARKLRILWYFGSNAQHYLVREDSGVRSLSDLNGKNFSPGGAGSATEKATEAFFEVLGIRPKYHRGTMGDAVNAVKDRRIVGFAKGGLGTKADSAILDVQTSVPLRALGFSDGQVATLKEKFPAQPWVKIPAGSIPGIDYEYTTWTYPLNILGTTDIPEDVVYRIVKAIDQHKARQAQVYPPVADFDIARLTAEMAKIPLHPGTIRYLEEKGIRVPDGLKG
ncbi:MAG TPA: TAXI family TRAP transporter solute-binding subunit [Thermodesulfobacteriota bacterium]